MKNELLFPGMTAVMLALIGCASPAGKTTSKMYTVEIKQMQFQPATLTLHKGDTVVFKNEDMVAHNITETSGKWTSGALSAGSSWKMVVSQSANYYCSVHPVMKGRLQTE